MPTVPDDVDLDALKAEQAALAEAVRLENDLPSPVETVGGLDVAYGDERCFGAVAILELDTLETVEIHTASVPIELPYIPGLLAYRELPAFEAVWDAATAAGHRPDVLLVDGGGLIHPRRLGSACHAGLRFDIPSIGVTKSLLLGAFDGELDAYRDTAPVRDDGELIGYAYRSSKRARTPIYVSPGHRITAETALEVTQRCCSGRRKLPEPVHRAHVAAGEARGPT